METVTVALDLPRDLLGALDVPQEQLAARLRMLIAIALFREGKISAGKGAEILAISKVEFVQLLAQYGIDYFTETPEELVTDWQALQYLLQGGF
jgi:predicted HTH domain antitoxin